MTSKVHTWRSRPPQIFTDSFLQYLSDGCKSESVLIGFDRDIIPVTSLLRILWHCIDILREEYCNILGLEKGSTYARAAQKIARAKAEKPN